MHFIIKGQLGKYFLTSHPLLTPPPFPLFCHLNNYHAAFTHSVIGAYIFGMFMSDFFWLTRVSVRSKDHVMHFKCAYNLPGDLLISKSYPLFIPVFKISVIFYFPFSLNLYCDYSAFNFFRYLKNFVTHFLRRCCGMFLKDTFNAFWGDLTLMKVVVGAQELMLPSPFLYKHQKVMCTLLHR